MSDKTTNNEVVFLFGAGISIPIGIPAMEGIYKAYMEQKKPSLSNKHKKVCELFTSDMGVKPDLEEFLLAANTILDFKGSGLSHFVKNNISKVKNTTRIKAFDKSIDASLNDIKEVRTGILEFLARECFKFDRKKAEKVNTGFVKTLSKIGYPTYSTNYDYAFEHVAKESNIRILDNFVTKRQRVLWNDKIDFETGNGFRLIKLHGSVTWYEDSEGTIEKLYSSTDINPAGKQIGKIVIFPTRFKDIYSQNFFALYSHFLGSLASSKVIIIAGHSLRDDYLRAAIIERKRLGNFQIIVVDPTYPAEIKKELPHSRIGTIGDTIHLPYKWEDLADELSHILINSEPDDIATQCVDILKLHKYKKNRIKIRGSLRALHINKIKSFGVDVKAYLTLDEKPSMLRAWLKAKYSNENGVLVDKFFADFIEESNLSFGNELTGAIDSNVELAIKIPKIPNWLNSGCKVTLYVGLVKPEIKTPSKLNAKNTVAIDSKLLNYMP